MQLLRILAAIGLAVAIAFSLPAAGVLTNNGDGTTSYTITAADHNWLAACVALGYLESGGATVPCTAARVTADRCLQEWLDDGWSIPEPAACLAYLSDGDRVGRYLKRLRDQGRQRMKKQYSSFSTDDPM